MFEYLPKTKSIWLLHCIDSHCQSSSCSILPKRIKTNRGFFGDAPAEAQLPLNGTHIISRASLNKAKKIYLLSHSNN